MLKTISDGDFQRLAKFIQSQYGINLTQKRQLVTSRLSGMVTEWGYDGFEPFVKQLLQERDPNKLELVLNKLTTNYTFFMRETEHFQFLKRLSCPS